MGVFVNSGLGAAIVATPETTYGQAAALTSAQPYEFNSETLELKKTIVQGKGLRSGGLHLRAARRVVTMYATSGGINLDLPTRYLNIWLYQMFGSKGQPLAALTQDATTGAYKSVHAPGPMLGSSLTIQKGVPSVDGTSANPLTYPGVKFMDWTLSVATGAIASLAVTIDGRNELGGTGTGGAGINGDALNVYPAPALAAYNEAPTNNIFHFREASLITGTPGTVSGGGSALSSPPAVPATTVAATSPYTSLSAVTITAGTITAVTVNGAVVGTTAGTYGVPAGGTIAITYSSAPTWAWFAGVTALTSPTTLGNVKSAEIKYAFHMDTERIFLGSAGFKAEPIENDFRDISGQFVTEWLNAESRYQAFASDTPLALELDFIGPGIGSGSDLSSLKVLIPSIYLDGESPKVGGPAVVTQTVPFTGLDNGTDNPIQATYISLDSV